MTINADSPCELCRCLREARSRALLFYIGDSVLSARKCENCLELSMSKRTLGRATLSRCSSSSRNSEMQPNEHVNVLQAAERKATAPLLTASPVALCGLRSLEKCACLDVLMCARRDSGRPAHARACARTAPPPGNGLAKRAMLLCQGSEALRPTPCFNMAPDGGQLTTRAQDPSSK